MVVNTQTTPEKYSLRPYHFGLYVILMLTNVTGVLIACLTLQVLSFIPTVSGVCSLYCGTCKNDYYNCTQCPTNFISTGSPFSEGFPNCTMDPNIYLSSFSLAQGEITLNNSATYPCGPYVGSGQFMSNTDVQFWTDSIVIPVHYTMRVMVSILFIDKWGGSSNKVSLMMNGASLRGINIRQSSAIDVSQQCQSNGGGGGGSQSYHQRYGKIDTQDILDVSPGYNLSLNGDSCSSSSCGWMILDLIVLFKLCDPSCLVCNGLTNTSCSQCATTYYLSSTTCDYDCLSGYYQTATPFICAACNITCTVCSVSANNCTQCKVGFIFYPLGNTCLRTCPGAFYNLTDPTNLTNYCAACDISCAICTNNPTPCQSCNPNYFLYLDQCNVSCPSPLVEDYNAWKCQNCSTYCVNMTLTQYTQSGTAGLSPLSFDLNFTFSVNFTTMINMPAFQKISFQGSKYNISNFNVTYINTSSRSYRITLMPLGYAFIINQSVTVTVIPKPDPSVYIYNGTDGRPFMVDVFNQTLTVNWTYVKPPNMTDTEVSVVSTLSSLSTSINTAFTSPGIQELKKFGFLLLVLNSLQITSCLILLNTILPQNLYEGIRFFASLIFYDVPTWEAESVANKYFVSVPISSIPSRRLLTVQVQQFTFRRTGFSGIFVFDAYSQIFLIIVSYLLLGISLLISSYWKKARRTRAFFESCLDGFHQIAVMYFTLTIVFEFTYFDGSKVKWISIIVCFLVNIYYFLYQLRVYYALLQYPNTPACTPKFEYFVTKYSFYLKNLRFDEENSDSGKCGIFKLWFRPHNYHILSFAKKFLMMLTFPLFYNYGYAQIIVLMVIQFFEILRFVFTWPYATRWRNITRLVLQSCLLAIFIIVFFIEMVIVYLVSGTASDSASWATLFFALGWIAFALVYLFNLSYFVLFCLNWFQNCNYTNQEIMEKSRNNYYFQLLKERQENNQLVPVSLMNQWVMKGNLNKRNVKELPQISYRIECYTLTKVEANYNLDIKTIVQLGMTSQFNYKMNDNNLEPRETIQKQITLHPMSDIFGTFQRVYKRFATSTTYKIVIKTFLDVEQRKYRLGDIVPMSFQKMHQQVQVHDSIEPEPRVIKQKSLMGEFPIPHDLLYKGTQMADGADTFYKGSNVA